jgi:hypothetical protein
MKYITNILTIGILLLANPIFSQQDSIPTNYFGCYSATFGDEGSGNEVHYCFGINGDPFVVYKEIFAGLRYVTYYNVISFDKQTGKLVLKSDRMINVEEDIVRIEEDTSNTVELRIIKKGNTTSIEDDNFSNASILKSDALEFEILNQNGIPTKFKKAKLEAEKAKVELEKFNTIKFTETEIESEFIMLVRTCTFRNTVIIDSIFGDCIDPECSSMSVLKMIDGDKVKIELSQLFKNGGFDVEKIINSKAIENLKRFQDRNSEEFDDRYVNSVYQNYTFKGKKMYDSHMNQNFYTNQIELRYISEENKQFQFRTFVEIEEGENYQQGDGMLFIEITYEELLPYFAE